MEHSDHYLEKELYSLLQGDAAYLDFLFKASLDGIWYWDLENPEQEYLSPRFWEVLGYDPKDKKHLSSEWQNLIFEEDLKVAIENCKKHCENPEHPYDQVVRYKHKNGSTVWIRCRGIAIFNEQQQATRLLGAHNDITKIMILEERFKALDHIMEINKNLSHTSQHDEL